MRQACSGEREDGDQEGGEATQANVSPGTSQCLRPWRPSTFSTRRRARCKGPAGWSLGSWPVKQILFRRKDRPMLAPWITRASRLMLITCSPQASSQERGELASPCRSRRKVQGSSQRKRCRLQSTSEIKCRRYCQVDNCRAMIAISTRDASACMLLFPWLMSGVLAVRRPVGLGPRPCAERKLNRLQPRARAWTEEATATRP